MNSSCLECKKRHNHMDLANNDFNHAVRQRTRANTYEAILRADTRLARARNRRDIERQTFLEHQQTHNVLGE